MIAVPAVDVRGGHCVQLVGGRPDEERVRRPDPVAEARAWYDRGFEALHVVDLDAALGSGSNTGLIARIVEETRASVQVGGGIRTAVQMARFFGVGARRVVVGTKAIDDPVWLQTEATRFPGRLVVALDTREGRLLRKGWTEEAGIDVVDYLADLGDVPIGGVLSTDVGREGRMEGIDREACARIIDASPFPVWVSGGVTTVDELEFLDDAGAAGVVLGMAIYTGILNADEVAARWGGMENGDA